MPVGIMPFTEGPVTITALPSQVNLLLYAGDDFTLRLDVIGPDSEPLDLSAADVDSHIRVAPESTVIAGVFEATVDFATILLHLDSPTSTNLPTNCVWDCQIILGGLTTTLVAGTIVMTPEVTRPL